MSSSKPDLMDATPSDSLIKQTYSTEVKTMASVIQQDSDKRIKELFEKLDQTTADMLAAKGKVIKMKKETQMAEAALDEARKTTLNVANEIQALQDGVEGKVEEPLPVKTSKVETALKKATETTQSHLTTGKDLDGEGDGKVEKSKQVRKPSNEAPAKVAGKVETSSDEDSSDSEGPDSEGDEITSSSDDSEDDTSLESGEESDSTGTSDGDTDSEEDLEGSNHVGHFSSRVRKGSTHKSHQEPSHGREQGCACSTVKSDAGGIKRVLEVAGDVGPSLKKAKKTKLSSQANSYAS